MDKVSMQHLISFWRYQTKCVIVDDVLNQPLKQWLTGKKTKEDENTKILISRERKELFRWNKKHFS